MGKLVWRLNGPLPTAEEVFRMVEIGIIDGVEAREILFTEVKEIDPKKHTGLAKVI